MARMAKSAFELHNLLGALLATVVPLTVALPQDSLCAPSRSLLAPSRDLYCLALVASPDIDGVSGQLSLGRAPGPFTVAVTAAGHIRYAPTMILSGLPAPASLGPYTRYVAWLATPVMYPVVRLGD